MCRILRSGVDKEQIRRCLVKWNRSNHGKLTLFQNIDHHADCTQIRCSFSFISRTPAGGGIASFRTSAKLAKVAIALFLSICFSINIQISALIDLGGAVLQLVALSD